MTLMRRTNSVGESPVLGPYRTFGRRLVTSQFDPERTVWLTSDPPRIPP